MGLFLFPIINLEAWQKVSEAGQKILKELNTSN